MTKFRVGERVRVVGAQANISKMEDLIGSIATIKTASGGGKFNSYQIEEDGVTFGWMEAYFEKLVEIDMSLDEGMFVI